MVFLLEVLPCFVLASRKSLRLLAPRPNVAGCRGEENAAFLLQKSAAPAPPLTQARWPFKA
jgi:hypothetical protein